MIESPPAIFSPSSSPSPPSLSLSLARSRSRFLFLVFLLLFFFPFHDINNLRFDVKHFSFTIQERWMTAVRELP